MSTNFAFGGQRAIGGGGCFLCSVCVCSAVSAHLGEGGITQYDNDMRDTILVGGGCTQLTLFTAPWV